VQDFIKYKILGQIHNDQTRINNKANVLKLIKNFKNEDPDKVDE